MLLTIPINTLAPHPDNANIMPPALFGKLRAHIKRTGKYPPVIVRPIAWGGDDGDPAERFQILDGHHRVRALRELGAGSVRCDVWDVDDHEAAILLLTLNRLEGSDDPRRRAKLVEELRASQTANFDLRDLEKLLPENEDGLARLLALARPPEISAHPAANERDIEPITFFLSKGQRARLLARLREVCADRTAALLHMLGIEEAGNAS
jgi:ParB-like chromosome segregation protein Spo0J